MDGFDAALNTIGDPNGLRSDIDQVTPVAGSTIGTSLGRVTIDNANGQTAAAIQIPANTNTPFTITLNCNSDLSATYVPSEYRYGRFDQTAWVHFTISNAAGASYSVSATGPVSGLIDGGQVGGGARPLETTTYGRSEFAIVSDPGSNGIPAVGQPSGNTLNVFRATPPVAAYTQTYANPNPSYLGSFATITRDQAGTASGVLPAGEYTIGLGCYGESKANNDGAYTYGGDVFYQVTYTVTISDAP